MNSYRRSTACGTRKVSAHPCPFPFRVAGTFLFSSLVWSTLLFATPPTARGQEAASPAVPADSTETPVWNQWRGPQRDATYPMAQWPDTLKLEAAWKVDSLGPSYSGPVTNGKMVFTTETVNSEIERTTAYDLKTGERVWEQTWQGALTVPFFAAKNGSWIRSTPACDLQHVYVMGIQDRLCCMNVSDGSIQWQINFGERFETGNPPFGAVCSPLIDGDFLFVQAANRFFKLNKSDGTILWETMEEAGGMSSGGSFSSPSMATINGTRQVLVQSRTALAGIDPQSGKILWQTPVPNFRGMNILTPARWRNSVFTSTYNNQSYLFQVGDSAQPTQVWQNSAKGYMASPAIVNDHAYLLLQNGRIACLDLTDGQRTWTSEQSFGEYASCIVNKDKILMLSEEGELLLLKAEPEFQQTLATAQLPGIKNSWAHLGIQQLDDGSTLLMVRGLSSLQVFRWDRGPL